LLCGAKHIIAAIILIYAALAVRALCLSYETLDYQDFLAHWVKTIRGGGGFKALKGSIGNYNLPYIYILTLISYLPGEPLYPIKLVSVAADILLAWSAMKTVGLLTANRTKKLITFFTVLLLPTVIINGALWGQCDSIYAGFGVLGIYLALSNRPYKAVVCIAVSFAFKLQAVFIIPVFAVFLMTRKIKLRHLPLFPAAYLITTIPAVIAGRPFLSTLTLYYDQADSVGDSLNYNSPSIFSIIGFNDYADMLETLGIALACVSLFGFLIYLFINRRRLTEHTMLASALLISICVPFFLPHMHDRYFFCADVLSVVFAVTLPRYLPVPVFCSFASVICYVAYLTKRYWIMPYYGAFCLIAAMTMTLIYIISRVYRTGRAARTPASDNYSFFDRKQ